MSQVDVIRSPMEFMELMTVAWARGDGVGKIG